MPEPNEENLRRVLESLNPPNGEEKRASTNPANPGAGRPSPPGGSGGGGAIGQGGTSPKPPQK